jgi:hypothetical protein
VIEINPRAAGQFYDLFERVDGYCLFEALLALHMGREPVIRHRQGRDRHAASFVLRDLAGEGLARWPSAAEGRAACGAASGCAHHVLPEARRPISRAR